MQMSRNKYFQQINIPKEIFPKNTAYKWYFISIFVSMQMSLSFLTGPNPSGARPWPRVNPTHLPPEFFPSLEKCCNFSHFFYSKKELLHISISIIGVRFESFSVQYCLRRFGGCPWKGPSDVERRKHLSTWSLACINSWQVFPERHLPSPLWVGCWPWQAFFNLPAFFKETSFPSLWRHQVD